jgi:hypothetical protein
MKKERVSRINDVTKLGNYNSNQDLEKDYEDFAEYTPSYLDDFDEKSITEKIVI